MLLSLLISLPTQKLKAQATDSFYLTFCIFDHVICIALAAADAVNYCE